MEMLMDLEDLNLYKAAESGNYPNKDTVLHVRSRYCDSASEAKQILERNPKLILEQNADKETPLHIAARKGHLNIVREIIDCIKQHQGYSSVLNCKNDHGNTALHEAIENNHREVIRLLVEEYPTLVIIKNDSGKSPLYLAAENGDEVVVAFILSCPSVTEYVLTIQTRTPATYCQNYLPKGLIRLMYYNHHTRNELHAAAIGNFPECTKLILSKLPHLAREIDGHGWMAIHYAARLNHREVVREMLLSDSCMGEEMALLIAVKCGHIQVIEEILTHSPNCWSTVNIDRENIIHIAVENEQQEVLNFILKKSWASELVNGRGLFAGTPLHYYVRTKRLSGSELVNHPAVKINALNDDGCTPLDSLRWETDQDEERKDSLRSELLKSGARESRFLPLMEQAFKTGWTKEDLNIRAETYQVVAALILTITFAAGFTVPGGYESNGESKGRPILLNETGYIAFFFFDYAAFFLSLLALFGLLIQPFITNKISQAGNLRICGYTIISSIGALFLAFVVGLFITLPRLGFRISLFVLPVLFSMYVVAKFCIVILLHPFEYK